MPSDAMGEAVPDFSAGDWRCVVLVKFFTQFSLKKNEV
jgi:hypothetical protein